MADERQLVVSLALKAQGYKSEISKINKETKLLQSEFDKAKESSEDFEDSLEGQEKKLDLLNGTLENARKKVTIYAREVERCETTLESATKAYEEQQENVAELERQLASARMTYGKTSQEVADLESKLDLANKSLEKSQKAVIAADSELLSLRTTLNKAESEVNQLSRQVDDTTKRIQEFEDGVDDTGQSLQELAEDLIDATSEAVSFGAHMSELGQGVMDVGDKIGGAGNSILSSLNEANQKAIEFDQSINQLKASAGLTAEEFESIDGVVDAIYVNNFGESYEDVADAVALVYKNLGYTGDKLQDITEKSFTLRDVFGYDIAESTRAVDTLMKQFGLTGEEALNLITQGAQSNLDYSGELLDTINEYSVQFYKAGLSADDMFNILQNGVNNGSWNLDKIGDAVKEFHIRLTDGSDSTADALKKLGYDAKDVASVMSSGGEEAKEMYGSIVRKLGDVDDAQKQNLIALDLFGTMWEDLGPDVVTNLFDIEGGFDNAKNSAEELVNVKYDDIGSAMDTVSRSIETGIVKELGQSLMPLMEKLVPVIQNVVDAISNWIENNPGLTSAIMIIAGVIGGLLAVLGPIITTIGMLVISIGALTSAFAAAGGIAAFFSTALLPIIGVIAGVIAAVVAIAMSIKENWEGIKQATSNLIETVKPHFEQFKESFAGLWSTCQNIYTTVIQPLFQIIGQIIEELIYFCTPLFQALLTTFSIVFDAISGVWAGVGQPVFAAAMQIIQKLWSVAQPIFRNLSSLISSVFSTISNVWKSVLKPVFEAIISIVNVISKTVASVFTGFVEDITSAMKAVLSPIQWVIDKLTSLFNWVSKAASSVGNFLNSVNPFRSVTQDVDVNARYSMPDINQRDIALSGAYYTPRSALSSELNSSYNSMLRAASKVPDVGKVKSSDAINIEDILTRSFAMLVQEIKNIQINPNLEVILDGQKMSNTLSTIDGSNTQLNERWR